MFQGGSGEHYLMLLSVQVRRELKSDNGFSYLEGIDDLDKNSFCEVVRRNQSRNEKEVVEIMSTYLFPGVGIQGIGRKTQRSLEDKESKDFFPWIVAT